MITCKKSIYSKNSQAEAAVINEMNWWLLTDKLTLS